jgi:metal-dependent amidase/aminoacylase/carboxypeptidase family protein
MRKKIFEGLGHYPECSWNSNETDALIPKSSKKYKCELVTVVKSAVKTVWTKARRHERLGRKKSLN